MENSDRITKIEKDIYSLKESMCKMEKDLKKFIKQSAPPKEPKEASEYNKFVKTKLSDPNIQALPHKERFGKVAELWKSQKKNTSFEITG